MKARHNLETQSPKAHVSYLLVMINRYYRMQGIFNVIILKRFLINLLVLEVKILTEGRCSLKRTSVQVSPFFKSHTKQNRLRQ